MHTLRIATNVMIVVFSVMISGCGGGGSSNHREDNDAQTFICGENLSCTEFLIDADPKQSFAATPSRFRGYADPSLEYDATNDELWLSYSWLSDLNTTISNPPPPLLSAVRTHLAKWNGVSQAFEYVTALNNNTLQPSPVSMSDGWLMHEVSTLLLQANDDWQTVWLTYHSRLDDGPREGGTVIQKGVATLPGDTGLAAQGWIGGSGTHSSYAPMFDLSTLPQLSDCTMFTEPALFRYQNDNYLGVNCVVISGPTRREDLERFVLLKDLGIAGYEFVAEVLDADDAAQFDAQRIEQVDFAFSQAGDVLLIGTPIQSAVVDLGGADRHLGCHIFEFTDFVTGLLNRNSNGELLLNAIVTDDATQEARERGPGACTYSPDSDTGLIIVRREFNISTTGIEFSLLETGLHF